MSQDAFGSPTSPLSGADLVNSKLEPAFNAILSNHSGATRPSYVTAGMMWLNTTTNPWILNLFDGADDIAIGSFNITSNLFTSASAGAATGVSFSNAASGLTATTVQAAIDEIVARSRTVPQNSKSADYTLVLADGGRYIYHPASDAAARIFSIPDNSAVAFPVDTIISFINLGGAVTLNIGTDTLIQLGSGATGDRIIATNGSANILKVAATTWVVSGIGIT